MLVAVKERRTKFRVEGDVPPWLLEELKKRYGAKLQIADEDPEALINVRDTEWFKDISPALTPAKALQVYRKNRGLTLLQLAGLLGPTVRVQNISNMENGSRGISKAMARKLAKVFGASPARFI